MAERCEICGEKIEIDELGKFNGTIVKRKTARKKLCRAIEAINQWCKFNRHEELEHQWKTLCQKVRGHYGFFGITPNSRSIGAYHEEVKRCWRKWLNRRNANNEMSWEKFQKVLKRYPLPKPRIVHSFT